MPLKYMMPTEAHQMLICLTATPQGRRLTVSKVVMLVTPWAKYSCPNKKLLGAKGIPTRSKDATRGSWPYY